MHRIDGAGNIAGAWVAENTATNQPPTEITPEWMNAVQEEMAAVIEVAGIALNKASNAQLLQALRASGLFQTAALNDATTKAATNEFVQKAKGNYRDVLTITNNTVLSVDDFGKLILVDATGGNVTITLPTAAGYGKNLKISKTDSTANIVIINRAGADVIVGPGNLNGGTLVTSATLRRVGDALDLTSNNASFYASGVGASALLAASGYQKLPSGLIKVWGSTIANAAGAVTAASFPITFPNAVVSMSLTASNASTSSSGAWLDSLSTSGFGFHGNGAFTVYWEFTGY